MGMAASQGRLLGLTARMSDVEFSSQQKCQQKVKLAMSTEAITNVYTEALNKTKFVGLTGFNNGSSEYADLSYDMLTGVNSPLAGDYCLTDASNRVVVPQAMKEKFDGKSMQEFLEANGVMDYTPATPGTPAIPAIPGTPAKAAVAPVLSKDYTQSIFQSLRASLQGAVTSAEAAVKNTPPTVTIPAPANVQAADLWLAESNWSRAEALVAELTAKSAPTQQIEAAQANAKAMKKIAEDLAKTPTQVTVTNSAYTAAVESLSKANSELALFLSKAVVTPGKAAVPAVPGKPAIPAVPPTPARGSATPEGLYYTNMFNRMTEGYTVMGDESKTINNKDWINNQLKNGGLFLEKFNKGKAEDQGLSECPEIHEVRDTKDLDIIEAKYNSDLLAIQTKDKKLDMDIKQLDTEHSAMQTEMDSVKKVIEKNIESSFKSFG
jgi:hypothetical protein